MADTPHGCAMLIPDCVRTDLSRGLILLAGGECMYKEADVRCFTAQDNEQH